MPGDVFHHHNRVIHQNADGENQREQAHPINRVAHHFRGKQRQQNRGRNHNQRHQRLAPANRQPDQRHDRQRCQPEMEQQLVGFLIRRRAVIPRHLHRDAVRDQPPLQPLQPIQNALRHHHRIRPGPLGEGNRHRRAALPDLRRIRRKGPHAMLHRRTAHDHARHIAHIDRPPVAAGQQQQPDIRHPGQSLPGHHLPLHPGIAHPAGQKRPIGAGNLGHQLLQRHPKQRQFLRVRLHPDLLRRAPGDIGQADLINLDHLRLHPVRELIQILIRPMPRRLRLRRQRQRHNGHVVNPTPHHQRLRNAGRHPVRIGANFRVHPHNRIVLGRADEKPRRQHHPVVLRLAIHVLNAVDALNQRLQRLGHQLHRIGRLQPVGADQNIHHRHAQLRLLLARDRHQRQHPGHQRR